MASAPDLVTATTQRRFTYGLGLPLKAVRHIGTTPGLWAFVAAPVALTALLLGGALWLTLAWGTSLTLSFMPFPEATGWTARFFTGLWYATNGLVHLLLFGFLGVISWFVSGILASPVYDQLSYKVEVSVLGDRDAGGEGLRQAAQDVATGVTHSILGLVLYLMVWAPLLLLQLVPFVGQLLYVGLGAAVSGFFLAREVLDYSFSRRRFSFVTKARLVWRHLAVCEGVGLTTLVLLWIPLVNFLSLPVAVVAGTLLYCEMEGQGLFADLP